MNLGIWGKHLWISIHFIALSYPHEPTKEDIQNYRDFFENLKTVIPCSKCRKKYTKHLQIRPLTKDVLSNQLSLFEWTVDIHNLTNESLGKETWSYDEALEYYSRHKNFKTI